MRWSDVLAALWMSLVLKEPKVLPSSKGLRALDVWAMRNYLNGHIGTGKPQSLSQRPIKKN